MIIVSQRHFIELEFDPTIEDSYSKQCTIDNEEAVLNSKLCSYYSLYIYITHTHTHPHTHTRTHL